jgi:site-specific DNA recombinase
MLFDANGNPMTPSHAVKQGIRYRYYVSRLLIIKDQTKNSAGLRIPAEEIEQLVPSRVRQWLLDPGSIYSATCRSGGCYVRCSTMHHLPMQIGRIDRVPDLP